MKLLNSYLENRKQYVDIDSTKSEVKYITTGVPQRSILGPLLFFIYINDIANASKLFNFIIYVDNTTLENNHWNCNSNKYINWRQNKFSTSLNKWMATTKYTFIKHQ